MQFLKDSIRKRIVDSAVLEFIQYGYSDASIRNIANNSNISLGNIYRYYDNKRALFLSIVNPFLEGIGEFSQPTDNKQQQVQTVVNYIVDHRNQFIIVKTCDTSLYSHLLDDIVLIFTGLFDNAKIRSAYRNPKFTRAIISSYLEALYQVIDAADSDAQCQDYAQELTSFFFESNKFTA